MILTLIISNLILLAQGPCSGCAGGGGPCAPCCPNCGPPPPPGLEIDIFVYVLLVIAVFYGAYKIYKIKSRNV